MKKNCVPVPLCAYLLTVCHLSYEPILLKMVTLSWTQVSLSIIISSITECPIINITAMNIAARSIMLFIFRPFYFLAFMF